MTTATRLATLVAGGCLLAGIGCGGDEHEFDYYFEARPYTEPACNRPDPRLQGSRLMRLYTHRDVEVTAASTAMAGYYQRYGFHFFTDRYAEPTTMPYALDTDLDGLNTVLGDEFPGVNLNDEAALMRDPELYGRVLRRTGNFLMRPMVEFAREHGNLGTGVTNLVVLRDLVRPGGAALGPPGASPAGLAVSPALIAAFAAEEAAEGAGVWPEVDFPPGFTPMMFLHGVLVGTLSGIDKEVRDLIAAHEFGHTAGLVHREKEGNLMLPFAVLGRSRCTDGLDPDQIATFRLGTGLDPAPQARLVTRARDPRVAVPPARLTALLEGKPGALVRFLSPILHLAR